MPPWPVYALHITIARVLALPTTTVLLMLLLMLLLMVLLVVLKIAVTLPKHLRWRRPKGERGFCQVMACVCIYTYTCCLWRYLICLLHAVHALTLKLTLLQAALQCFQFGA
jgi:hypothetical protein